jgi:protein kinase C substrate 80K-H
MWLLLRIVAAAALLCVRASSSLVAGIPASQRFAYAGDGASFTCLDGSRRVPLSAVNDDYCDCADGSDEPGTSACKNGRFFCPQKGARSKFVPSSLVGDGHCDCCDGADEAAAAAASSRPLGAVCHDTCFADGAASREARAAAIARAEQGAALRAERAAAAAAARTGLSGRVASLRAAAVEKAAVKSAADERLRGAQDAHDAAVAEKKAANPGVFGDRAVEAALGVADASRADLLALLVAHVRETASSAALVARVATMVKDGRFAGE